MVDSAKDYTANAVWVADETILKLVVRKIGFGINFSSHNYAAIRIVDRGSGVE